MPEGTGEKHDETQTVSVLTGIPTVRRRRPPEHDVGLSPNRPSLFVS